MTREKLIPNQYMIEQYWHGVNRYYLTQTYIVYTRDRLPLAAFGGAGLFMEHYISQYA